MPVPKRKRLHHHLKPVVLLLCLLPLAVLCVQTLSNNLGANPAEALIRSTGLWALRFLCLALAITPLRLLAQLPILASFRRMVGLVAFTYACLHLLAYAWLELGFTAAALWQDAAQRPFITLGLLCWLVLLALAATSPARMVRTLGGKRWQALHRWVYAAGILAVLHFYWMRAGKHDFAQVWLYGVVIAGLLLYRLLRRWGWLRRHGKD